MAYSISIEPSVKDEIDAAFDYYYTVTNNPNVFVGLLNDIEQAYSALRLNPYFQVRTKNYRALPLKKYPYILFFEVLEEEKIVLILSFFNTSQSTSKWPK